MMEAIIGLIVMLIGIGGLTLLGVFGIWMVVEGLTEYTRDHDWSVIISVLSGSLIVLMALVLFLAALNSLYKGWKDE